MRASGWEFDPAQFPPDERYPNLYTGPYGPTAKVLELAESPLDLDVAKESNRYFLQNLTARVDQMHTNQRTPRKKPRDRFMMRAAKKDDIKPHEILHI
ncbi:hypothetical protein PHPALM_28398 [Phytophthora palmivora]|uniref:Uncharacterized protein n=1 Tax=Phytophthora palmivora TaxID=4796 RepID=A0A2P4XA73_9STRA|nr:hypothetical protein PHPALM_28398 [Phytophthora palmivora]